MNVLLLNSQYLPIKIVTMKKAINLIFRGAAIVEKQSDFIWKSPSFDFQLPSIVRLLNYNKLPNRTQKLSKKNILIRDKYTCAYCKEVFNEKSLSLDHIIPKSRGGSSKWENLVAACKMCNGKKGDRTPEEAGFHPIKKPNRMSIHTHNAILINLAAGNPEWSEYIYGG
jgi:5-methylcytosine-specific restriction endonuclease McrA